MTARAGTPAFCAPEVFLEDSEKREYGHEIDSYSFGHVLYSCVTCTVEPQRFSKKFGGYEAPNVTAQLLEHHIHTLYSTGGDTKDIDDDTLGQLIVFVHALIAQCFVRKGSERPLFPRILQMMEQLPMFTTSHRIRVIDVEEECSQRIEAQEYEIAGRKKQWCMVALDEFLQDDQENMENLGRINWVTCESRQSRHCDSNFGTMPVGIGRNSQEDHGHNPIEDIPTKQRYLSDRTM